MKKNKIFVACDSTNIFKIKKIIKDYKNNVRCVIAIYNKWTAIEEEILDQDRRKTTSEGGVFQPLIMDLATLMVMEI